MELTALKMLAGLLSGMSLTEAFSLLFIIGVAMITAGKGAFKAAEMFNKNKGTSADTSASKSQGINNEQMLLQFGLLKDKLNTIEQLISNNHFEMPKELSTELAHITKKIEDNHNITVESSKDILKMISVVEDGLSIIKEKISQIENQLPHLKSDSKDVLREVNQNVQSISRDVATLQGTILGNLSSRGGR